MQHLPGPDAPVRSGGGEPDKYYATGKRNYLRTALPDDLQGSFAARWAKELGAESAVVIHDTEPFGRGVALPFAERCRELGIEVVREPIGIVPKQDEYGELAERVAASGADLVFYGGIIQNGAGQLWRDVRMAAPEAKMMGSDALFEEAFIADAGHHAEGTLITFGSVPPALLEGPGKAFFRRYVERFGKQPESNATSPTSTRRAGRGGAQRRSRCSPHERANRQGDPPTRAAGSADPRSQDPRCW